MNSAATLGVTEINAFIEGIKQDYDAVQNAVIYDYNNRLAEGTVNKIKVVKRIMYGRCRFPLLKNKCLLLDYFFDFNQLWKEPICRLRIFPMDDVLIKMLFMATQDVLRKWTGRVQNWNQILLQLSIYFHYKVKSHLK
jgi:transposase-like protein